MDPTEAAKHPGARVFKAKNCMACHKWHGEGGTGYGAASVNLRETILNREQLIEVISCGRPGTSMPRHLKVAYDGFACYGGMTAAELGQDLPVRAKQYASKFDINAVAEFIHDFFKGRLQVEKGDCEVFFGVGARTCGNIELPRGAGGSGH